MKRSRILLLLGTTSCAAGLAGCTMPSENETAQVAPITVSGARQPTPPIAPLVQAIGSAADPSAAIAAYANAERASPGNPDINGAYIARMVAFGLPEMAEAQARALIRERPEDGLAWAVAAYMDGKRGQPSQALQEITVAIERSPDSPFVQRVAGQLVGWYDSRADQESLYEADRDVAQTIRSNLQGQPAFADAYRRAKEAYAEADAADAAQRQATTRPATTRPASR